MDRGKIVKDIVKSSGIKLLDLARILGITRQALDQQFKNHNLNRNKIEQIGNAIGYNFSIQFPELFGVRKERPVSVPNTPFAKVSVELDGSPEKLESEIARIRRINDDLSQ